MSIKDVGLTANQFFDDCPSSMLIYDLKTLQILAVNQAAIRGYGYTKEEFLNLSIKDIWHPDDTANMREMVDRISSEQYYDGGRWRHLKKNGQAFYVHTYSNTTNFSSKKARMVLMVDEDKSVEIEKKNKDLQEETENILESITDAFMAADENWNLIYVNRAAEKMYNVKREDLLHKNVWGVFPKTLNTRFYDEFQRAVREQVTVHVEGLSPTSGRWVLASAYPTKKGIAVYFKDYSEQKKLQEQVSNNIQNLNSLINNTSDLIWSVDTEYKIIFANQAFKDAVKKLNGISIAARDYAMPKELGPDIVRERKLQYDKALSGEAFMAIDERLIVGVLVYRETNFNPIKDDNGNVIGVSCLSRDVTERNKQMNRIKQQNEQLKEIAWIQSHKVRGPIATILGLAQLFNAADSTDPANEEILKGIQDEALKLDHTIREVVKKTYNIDH